LVAVKFPISFDHGEVSMKMSAECHSVSGRARKKDSQDELHLNALVASASVFYLREIHAPVTLE
jgi:hypothetical protein